MTISLRVDGHQWLHNDYLSDQSQKKYCHERVNVLKYIILPTIFTYSMVTRVCTLFEYIQQIDIYEI